MKLTYSAPATYSGERRIVARLGDTWDAPEVATIYRHTKYHATWSVRLPPVRISNYATKPGETIATGMGLGVAKALCELIAQHRDAPDVIKAIIADPAFAALRERQKQDLDRRRKE